jgi:hypothetical protein
MESHEPTHKLTVKTNLAVLLGTLQRSLQRARDIAAFGLNAADNITEQGLQLPGAFFQVVPASNVALDFETAKSEFKRWTLTGAMRDSVEGVHAFLDEARPVCFLYSVASKPMINGGDWNKGIVEDTKKFHRLGLPDKIKYLGEKYDSSLVPEVAEELLSINLARNCLVHRHGVVSDYDSNSDEGLLVKWRRMEIVATGYRGERTITAMARVEAGESVMLRHAKAQKLFRKGEFLTFSVDEFGELCLTLFFFGNQLVQNIERYGRSKGVHFDAPRKNVTGQSDT